MSSTRVRRDWWIVLVVAAACSMAHAPAVSAQAAKKALTIPKPETITLDTPSGVVLVCVYFPGGFIQKSATEVVEKDGKEVVPVVLLHGYEGRGADYYNLAASLQRLGHAVVVPDLRGHGQSNKIKVGNVEREIELDKLNRNDFATMVNDVEAVKKFLYQQNNEAKLNVEMLCLVGADLGGIVATNWVALDWSRDQLVFQKQGRSAKALILLSPVNSIKGYNATAAWQHPVFRDSRFSIMLVAGQKDSKSLGEAKQIYNRLERFHPLPTDSAERIKKQSLFLIDPPTELSGTKLVNYEFRLSVPMDIVQFINLRLVNHKDDMEFKWGERKSPLASN